MLLLSGLLFFLIALKDAGLPDPKDVYQQAHRLFSSGYLAQAERLAHGGYNRSIRRDPALALRFRLLEAESILWRGMRDENVVETLASVAELPSDPHSAVLSKSLEAVALIHVGRLEEASTRIGSAEKLCALNPVPECGRVLLARGSLALGQGYPKAAIEDFGKSLAFSRSCHDRWTEANALINLGVASLEEDRLDDAVEELKTSSTLADQLVAGELQVAAMGNEGWAYYRLGDSERALGLLRQAVANAEQLGDARQYIWWLTTVGYVYASAGKLNEAEDAYEKVLRLAKQAHSAEDVSDALTDLAQVEVDASNLQRAENYIAQAIKIAEKSGSRPDMLDATAIEMQVAALRGDAEKAKQLLHEVEAAPESQSSMKWASELAMARLYEAQGKTDAAQGEYTTALGTFEAARAELQHEDSQLPFIANATRIYDDYIHFLVKQGKIEEALLAADQSRARTLAQGLGESAKGPAAEAISPAAVARKAGATLLFYWLGEKQSYLWAITPSKTQLFPLPAKAELTSRIERYRGALQGPEDPIAAGNADGRALFAALVSPVEGLVRDGAPVMILADGALCQLNFETLIAPANPGHMAAHYWIEDATVISAPSLAMLAAAKPSHVARRNLLLVGDAVSPDASYPRLAYAAVEMQQVQRHFALADRAVFAREQATPQRYLRSDPRQYAYIHFVSHGVASQTDPLDSAIILSRVPQNGPDAGHASAGEDSFKLYAREIMQHPIDARLVTISACYGSGTRAYVGEGLVGLSWAFLHAGAHNAIGALWEASDRSTAELMDGMYQGLAAGETPGAALRRAKLALLHSEGSYRKPFYWAPFQMYSRL